MVFATDRKGWQQSCSGGRLLCTGLSDRLGKYLFFCVRPAADIGLISESARCWGMSRRSCPAPTHHSKRYPFFSTCTFLIGRLGPRRDLHRATRCVSPCSIFGGGEKRLFQVLRGGATFDRCPSFLDVFGQISARAEAKEFSVSAPPSLQCADDGQSGSVFWQFGIRHRFDPGCQVEANNPRAIFPPLIVGRR